MTRSLRQITLAALLGAAAFAALGTAQAHDRHGHRYESRGDRIDERQYRQARAIQHGWRSGQLTRHEARHLMRQQERIRDAEAWARADGHVSWRERERIDALQDHARHSIQRSLHDRDGW